MIGMLLPGMLVCLLSCGLFEPTVAVLWTDRPEFAIYGAYFNASQEDYKVETRYYASPAHKLTATAEFPDIVVGNWLKSVSTRSLFKPLDSFFKHDQVAKSAFYPRLLALGNIEGKQYLLPVAFNIPAIVFARANGSLLANPFTISLEELKALGTSYNMEQNGVYFRMGFSPAWNDAFLFVVASLFHASFREADPLGWDPDALEQAIGYLQSWTRESNTSIQAEDDFAFKYFYDPPAKLAASGRILFTYMNSAEFFALTPEGQANLDFRWIAEQDTIPLFEETVYYGIYKRGKAKKAAAAFTQWFFQAETQRLLLEISKNQGIHETIFGISSGFSALRTVTEQIFPQFYPNLLGHMPPDGFLSPPNILPRNWDALKEQVILPYLRDRIRQPQEEAIRPLERRVNDWYRINRDF
ncbi:MAG: extracellular solute-binding protein [Treponema sp.]|nr:extracellular solute-binding protein [Treponema sp.]